ncbi:unnamed protein product [Colias eurytheme]|nr:unnamed protein product [Colias eurytheme]
MANKCSCCGKFFSTTDGAKCTKCNIVFHKACNNISPQSKVNMNWQCKTCKIKFSKAPATVCTDRNECGDVFEDACVSESVNQSPMLAQEIHLLRTELSAFRLELSRLTTLVSEFNTRLGTVEERVIKLEQCRPEQTEILDTIETLKIQINESEQAQLLNDLEISGVPESASENPSHLIMTLSQKLGINVDEQDIMSAHRAGGRRDRTSDADGHGATSASARPRPLVVRFVRRSMRDELLKAARVRRGADTSGTDIPGETRRFYVNERLTSINRRLFYLAREEANIKNWRFIWTRGGRIFVRRDAKSSSHWIRSETELRKVFSSFSN